MFFRDMFSIWYPTRYILRHLIWIYRRWTYDPVTTYYTNSVQVSCVRVVPHQLLITVTLKRGCAPSISPPQMYHSQYNNGHFMHVTIILWYVLRSLNHNSTPVKYTGKMSSPEFHLKSSTPEFHMKFFSHVFTWNWQEISYEFILK